MDRLEVRVRILVNAADPRFAIGTVSLLGYVCQQQKRGGVRGDPFNMLFVRRIIRRSSQEVITFLDQGLIEALWSVGYFRRETVGPQDNAGGSSADLTSVSISR